MMLWVMVGDHINFEERIVDWQTGRKLGWAFNFTNSSVQDYTDKHISPDGVFLKIDSGDYVLRPISSDMTEVTLTLMWSPQWAVRTVPTPAPSTVDSRGRGMPMMLWVMVQRPSSAPMSRLETA